jgi:hypothetical protein
MKIDKPHMNIGVVNGKATTFVVPNISITIVAINNHMVVIQVQIVKNTIDDVLLDGGLGVNIIIEKLRARLGLLKPKPIFYNLRMVNQTTTKPVGLIKDVCSWHTIHSYIYNPTKHHFIFQFIPCFLVDLNS